MKLFISTCIAISGCLFGYSQKISASFQYTATVKGAVVKEEQGTYADPYNKRRLCHYRITYLIDTAQQQLLQVATNTKDRRAEVLYFYRYHQNRLAAATAGVVQDGYAVLQNSYTYEDADFRIGKHDLDVLSLTEEKYALLKESGRYVAVLKK